MGTTNFDAVAADSFVGDIAGTVTGNVRRPISEITANGAITAKEGRLFLNKAGVLAATLADPVDVVDDKKTLTIIAKTANAHTVTIAGGLNGVGSGKDVGTFDGTVGSQFTIFAYGGKWWQEGTPAGVTFA